MDWKFNKYKFYTEGHNVGFIPDYLTEECNRIIGETHWVGDRTNFADWSLIPDEYGEESWYGELVRSRLSYANAPTSMKNLANEVIDLDFFEPLKDLIVKKQHQTYRGIRNIMPIAMGLWNKQDNLTYHNDISDGSDFFVLIYINPYEEWKDEWGGHLLIGKEDENGQVTEVYRHRPVDSTFVMINNTNPLFKHSVRRADNHERYTFGIRYKMI